MLSLFFKVAEMLRTNEEEELLGHFRTERRLCGVHVL